MPGLTNIGNTCYGNATIQALRHQADLTLFMLQNKHDPLLSRAPNSEKTRLISAYADLMRELWKDGPDDPAKQSIIQTRPFWGQMIPAAARAGFEQFRIPMAHDAHEFLVFLLDQLHEGLSVKTEMTIRHHPSHTDTDRAALESWRRFFSNSYSPLVEILFGLQMRTVSCETCKKESNTWETMNMLKASVPASAADAPIQMMDLLTAESKGDVIEDYHCESCPVPASSAPGWRASTRACIQQRLWRLGAWVIIVLKRNEAGGRRIQTQVQIPHSVSFEPLFVAASPEPSRTKTYELFASIHHHGSARGGHYTSFARSPVTGVWAHFDDERVAEVASPTLDASTYIVMYRSI
jgi:ubiquitin C-terminal hydrolase